MRVLLLSSGADTGGQGIRIKTTIERHLPGWEARSIVASQNYIRFPVDLEWHKIGFARVKEHYEAADVVHLRNDFGAYTLMEGRRGHRAQRKPAVIHHHGTLFRKATATILSEAERYGAKQVCSTIDLLTFAPEGVVEWCPTPMDIEALAGYRQAPDESDKVRIYHSPTNRRVKDTEHFEATVKRLQQKYPFVEYQIAEGITWSENLHRKGRADIVYDQLVLGWGNNALEAWAMGIPVVGGVEFDDVRERMHSIIGPELPFEMADRSSLYNVLEALIFDPERRRAAGQRGRAFVERFHAEEKVAPRLARIYAEAAGVEAAA